jgi:hypothetical protein
VSHGIQQTCMPSLLEDCLSLGRPRNEGVSNCAQGSVLIFAVAGRSRRPLGDGFSVEFLRYP